MHSAPCPDNSRRPVASVVGMEVFGIVITGSVIVFLGRLGYVAYQSMVRAAEERQRRMNSQ